MESILNVDSKFNEIISKLSELDPVAEELYNLLGNDIKTNLNYLKPADNNQDIFFVNDTQVQRILDKGENPFDKAVNRSKIGRSVQQILKANWIEIESSAIEKFVNNYKNMYDQVVLGKLPEADIEVVRGKMITFWYDESNYVMGGSTLNNSCMRYDECQDYFEIYEMNPEVCQMIILKDKSKLAGRALLWKLADGRFYLDRIYTRYDNQVDIIYNYFKKLYPTGISHYQDEGDYISVQLKYWDFKMFPYLDSLQYLGYKDGILTDLESKAKKGGIYFKLTATDGDPSVYGGVWSERLDQYLDIDQAIDIGDNDYVTLDMCQWSKHERTYVFEEDVVESEPWGILNRHNSTKIGKEGESIWVPIDQIIEVYQDGNFIKVIKDNFNYDGYVRAMFQTSTYFKMIAYAKDEDCINLDDNKYIFNNYLREKIKNENILELNKVDQKLEDLLKINPYYPIIKIDKHYYLPTKFSKVFDLESSPCRTYIQSKYLWESIFLERDLIVTDVLEKYPTEWRDELMKIHEYLLNNHNRYEEMVVNSEFKKNISQSIDNLREFLNKSEIKKDLFSLSQLVPEKYWGGKIPPELGQDFKEDEFQYLKELLDLQDNSLEEESLKSKILERYLLAWQKTVFYFYLTRGHNREGYIKHLFNQDIIKSKDRNIIEKLTYDEFRTGRYLFTNSREFYNLILEYREILVKLDFSIIDQLFDLYMKKEGF